MVDPSCTELASITDFSSAAEWAGVAGDPSDATTPRGALLKEIGSPGDASVSLRILGAIPEAEWEALVVSWKIDSAPASLIVKAAARLLGRACRLKIGTQQSAAAITHQEELQQQLTQAQTQLAQAQAGAMW